MQRGRRQEPIRCRILDSRTGAKVCSTTSMSTVLPPPKGRRGASKPALRPVDAAARPIGNVAWIPPALTAALFLISLTPRVQAHAVVLRSFWSVIGALIVWQATLFLLRPPRSLTIVLAPPRRQHYIQAMCHLSVYAYW